MNKPSLPMINNDTPEELNNYKGLKTEGRSSLKTIKLNPSLLLIAKIVNYSRSLQVINTNLAGNFFLILN